MTTLLSHLDSGDCIIIDESLPLSDDVEVLPTHNVTMQRGTGGTITASLYGGTKVTNYKCEKTDVPLWHTLSSSKSLHAKTRLERKHNTTWSSQRRKASDIAAISYLYGVKYPNSPAMVAKIAARPLKIAKAIYPMILARATHRFVFPVGSC